MRCPQCHGEDVQYLIDAYVIYAGVNEDGSATIGSPRIQTFDDDRFLECRDCGWLDENVDLHLGDVTLTGVLDG